MNAPWYQRLFAKLKVAPATGCWEWKGATSNRGYGKLYRDGRLVGTHRLSYEFYYGEIPAGLHVCHRCDNPPCINPAHLFLGTIADNARDRTAKGRGSDVRIAGLAAPKGTEHHNSKLTPADVRAIRADVRFHRLIAEEFGVSPSLVSQIKRNIGWRHVT